MKKAEPVAESIPENLNVEPFLSLWADFQQHRVEIKKPMTPMSMKLTLKKLAAVGIDGACAAVTESIENGWQGVFPRQAAPQATLPESEGALWDRWRNARRACGRSDPAHAPGDKKALEAIACECRTGPEFWHVFKAYCEEEELFLQTRGWALEWLPSRMSKYTDALLACRSMKNRNETLTNDDATESPTMSQAAIDAILSGNIPY